MIGCPTEDELVSTDELQEKIAEFDDYVQSTDIAAMQSESITINFVQPMANRHYHRIVKVLLYFSPEMSCMFQWFCCTL